MGKLKDIGENVLDSILTAANWTYEKGGNMCHNIDDAIGNFAGNVSEKNRGLAKFFITTGTLLTLAAVGYWGINGLYASNQNKDKNAQSAVQQEQPQKTLLRESTVIDGLPALVYHLKHEGKEDVIFKFENAGLEAKALQYVAQNMDILFPRRNVDKFTRTWYERDMLRQMDKNKNCVIEASELK